MASLPEFAKVQQGVRMLHHHGQLFAATIAELSQSFEPWAKQYAAQDSSYKHASERLEQLRHAATNLKDVYFKNFAENLEQQFILPVYEVEAAQARLKQAAQPTHIIVHQNRNAQRNTPPEQQQAAVGPNHRPINVQVHQRAPQAVQPVSPPSKLSAADCNKVLQACLEFVGLTWEFMQTAACTLDAVKPSNANGLKRKARPTLATDIELLSQQLNRSDTVVSPKASQHEAGNQTEEIPTKAGEATAEASNQTAFIAVVDDTTSMHRSVSDASTSCSEVFLRVSVPKPAEPAVKKSTPPPPPPPPAKNLVASKVSSEQGNGGRTNPSSAESSNRAALLDAIRGFNKTGLQGVAADAKAATKSPRKSPTPPAGAGAFAMTPDVLRAHLAKKFKNVRQSSSQSSSGGDW